MKAYILNNRVHELISDEVLNILQSEGGLPPGFELVDVPEGTKPRSHYRNGKVTPASEGSEFHENYINAQIAKQELVISDRVIVRCYEMDATPVPQEWRTYRDTLRQMIVLENDEASPPIPLPPRPPAPFPFP